jgi:rRNA-processing protein FCF1
MRYAVIDTNTFLHFQLFTELDWLQLLESEEVQLIVPSTVLQELDKKKFNEQDINLRNRAKKVISTFNQILNNKLSFKKENIRIEFLPNEPNIDWKKENLDMMIPDDRIIATCLELFQKYSDLILITADFGLKLKANNKHIQTVEISDTYLLKEKQSKEQNELKTIREKLSKIESTIPKLYLKFKNDDELTDFIKFTITKQTEYHEEKYTKDIDDKVNQLLILAEQKMDNNIHPILGNVGIRQNDFDEFKEKLEKHKSVLYKYYENVWKYEEFLTRLLKIDFFISNEGTCPGNDVDIKIHFPDGFKICDEKKLPNRPEEPLAPGIPLTLAESLRQSLNNSNYFQIPSTRPYERNMVNIPPPNISGPSIKKTNSYNVTFHVNSIKHKTNYKLKTIFLYFYKYSDIKSFSIDYTLLAANYPDKFEGKLNIIVNLE